MPTQGQGVEKCQEIVTDLCHSTNSHVLTLEGASRACNEVAVEIAALKLPFLKNPGTYGGKNFSRSYVDASLASSTPPPSGGQAQQWVFRISEGDLFTQLPGPSLRGGRQVGYFSGGGFQVPRPCVDVIRDILDETLYTSNAEDGSITTGCVFLIKAD